MQIPVRAYWNLLRTYLRPLWPKVLLLLVLLAGSIGLQLYSPQVMQGIIDAAVAGAPVSHLLQAALLFLGLALGNQALAVAAGYLSRDVGWRATNALRTDLTHHALTLDLSYHKARTPGEMIERIDGDVTVLANFFAQFVVLVLANLVLLGGVLAVLYRVDWRAGLALTAFTGLNLWALLKIRSVTMRGWQASRQASAEYFGFLGERLEGTEGIRANGAEPFVLRSFYQMLRKRLAAEQAAGRGMAIMLVVSFGLLAVGMTTAFAVSAYLVTAGAISVGTAYMIFAYTEGLRRPVEQIINQVQDLARASASISRIQALLQTRSKIESPRVAPPLPEGPLSVEFDAVTFGYGEGEPVLADLSFRLEPGQVLGLLGRTGSGKTTVARLLARLYDAQAGAIRLGGVDLRAANLAELRRRVAVVTQDVQLFQGSLRENLTLFDPTIADDRIWRALDEVGMRPWAESLPQRLDTPLQSGGAGLSAGEAQLLAFARVFLRNPGLVILDEPSSRLDPATEQRLERAVDRLLQGRTGIIIAHRLSTVQRADQVLILAGGRLAEYGDRAALATDPGSRFYHLLCAGLEEATA
jgi:ATP-binding cassette subfamily B protein